MSPDAGCAADLVAPLGQVPLEPRPGLGAEGLLLVAPGQVHQAQSASRFRVASASARMRASSSATVGQLVDDADDLTGGEDADLGLAVDHRRLDQHRGVGGQRHLAPREVLVALHGQALAHEVAERRAGLLAEPQRGERRPREAQQLRATARCGSTTSVWITRCGAPSSAVVTTVSVTDAAR